MTKVDKVVEALSVSQFCESDNMLLFLYGKRKVVTILHLFQFNKLLCRSAATNPDFIGRIAADPEKERQKKKDNMEGNSRKGGILKLGSQKRAKTKESTGKRKRVAAESEPKPKAESDAEGKTAEESATSDEIIVASETPR